MSTERFKMVLLSGLTAGALTLALPGVGMSASVPTVAPEQPRRLAPKALGQDGRITLTPAFSPDGRTMYFAQSECGSIGDCPQRLKRSTLGAAGWSKPRLVPLPQDARVDYPSVTPDGKRLLFSWAAPRARHVGRDVGVDFDLYSLDLADASAIPKPLDTADINRIRGGAVRKLRYVHNETGASLMRNGDLYFWTERLDGIGERDVYLAPNDGRGGFRTARPLPPPINSKDRDDGAWVHPDGKLMLITYDARGGSGGSDIFVSRKEGAVWSRPVNLGPTVNSPSSDFSARITPDGRTLVFTSTRPFDRRATGLLQVWAVPTASVPALRLDLSN